MLTALEGGGQPDDRLAVSDLPLGPWSGAEVQAWASKTGTVWHCDPDCSSLRSRARTEIFAQPVSGTMADIRLPERAHCYPAGELGDYRRAVDAMVAFDEATCAAMAELKRQDLTLAVLDEWIDDGAPRARAAESIEDDLCREPLVGYWESCKDRRARVVSEIRRKLDDRLPVMLAAAWVENGRTPRQHQERYVSFLEVAVDECDQRDIDATSGIRSFTNDKVLPYWLAGVARGTWPPNETKKRVDREVERAKQWNRKEGEDFYSSIREAWLATAAAWTRRLEGVAIGHPGEVFALFHRYRLGLGWDLRDLFDTVIPHASLDTREFNWIAAKVPAVFSLFLTERERGLTGLVLDNERTHHYDASTAALFLRNLMIDLGQPDLARHVRERGPGAREPERETTERSSSSLPWQLHGFGTGVTDAGLTREQCLPALRAAIDGTALASGAAPPRRRRPGSRQ